MVDADVAAVEEFVAGYRSATGDGTVVAGAFGFGDTPAMADELADLVRTGPKRATAGAVVEFEADGEALPEPGQLWVVHDGQGAPVCLTRSTQVRRGPLDATLDPAFAWAEGEGDRTYEDWLQGHTRYWTRTLGRVGAAFTPDLDVVLERFEVLWPQPDAPVVLARVDDIEVRELRHDEREWAARVLQARWDGVVAAHGEVVVPAGLPALVAHRGAEPVGLLTFRPRHGVATEVVTLDALVSGVGAGTILLKGVEQLARLDGWKRLWLVTTNDNLRALRTYQRAGWRMVAVRPDAVDRARELKPSIPTVGLDGIPLRDEIELELPL